MPRQVNGVDREVPCQDGYDLVKIVGLRADRVKQNERFAGARLFVAQAHPIVEANVVDGFCRDTV
ncbi:unnamed protein product [marine sediment metagenome]|uniref:Uncharacterized protein n=1 Tax=marine sediment metagenome TaxID=412755 RepID=X0XZQ2_9ZZZZ